VSNDLLIEELAQWAYDPYGFVLWNYPWGEPGELEAYDGPNGWQADVLQKVGSGVLTLDQAVQIAVTSGHGVGKSALVSWLLDWAQSTCEDTRGVVTANTENQLKTKTWVEVAKWHRLGLTKQLFKLTATARFSVDPEHEKTWRIDMVPWSERNTESFAGLHNYGKRIIVVFDEASAIPDIIHEVTEGALTDRDTEIIWLMFGNPTRNKGRFREAFPGGRFASRWHTLEVDSRTVPGTNKTQIARWIEDYGEDSDFVRVRVLGKFPRVDAESFIPLDLAKQAVAREPSAENPAPIIFGVDVGRFGDDPSVIYLRQGRDGKSRPPRIFRGLSTMALCNKVVDAFNEFSPISIFVDGGGVGGGVVDRLIELGLPITEVQFGAGPDNSNPNEPLTKYENKRAEIWGAMRHWLQGGCIVEEIAGQDQTLPEEIAGPSYSFNKRDHIVLQSKADMKRAGLPSPNVADALALTFAYPTFEYRLGEATEPEILPDYDPFDPKRLAA
jgi:hypothetical protein